MVGEWEDEGKWMGQAETGEGAGDEEGMKSPAFIVSSVIRKISIQFNLGLLHLDVIVTTYKADT